MSKVEFPADTSRKPISLAGAQETLRFSPFSPIAH
jgi:hypothetical protein